MQHGHVQLPLWEIGIEPHQPYVVEDLLDGSSYIWQGEWNFVKLDPAERMATHIRRSGSPGGSRWPLTRTEP